MLSAGSGNQALRWQAEQGQETQTLRADSSHGPHSDERLVVLGTSLPLGKPLLESSSLVKAPIDLIIVSTLWSWFCLFEATLETSPPPPARSRLCGVPRRAVTVLHLAKCPIAFWSHNQPIR